MGKFMTQNNAMHDCLPMDAMHDCLPMDATRRLVRLSDKSRKMSEREQGTLSPTPKWTRHGHFHCTGMDLEQ